MFVGYRRVQNQPIFDAMKNAIGINFHLTGSRFFGTATETSDWDFFAQYCPGNKQFLKSNGFVELTDSSQQYNDQETKCVMRFTNGSLQIDVQLVNDVTKKCRINNAIKHRPDFLRLMNSIKKEERTAFWDLLYFATGNDWFNRVGLDRAFDNSTVEKALKSILD